MNDQANLPIRQESVFDDPTTVDLTRRQEKISPEFAAFLRTHRTEAGDILLGKAGIWTESQMRSLEETILKQVLNDQKAVDYFRLLKRFTECWIWRGKNQKKRVPMPRVAVRLPEMDNPFKMDLAKAFRNYRAWAEWLAAELESQILLRKSIQNSQLASIVPLLTSSILYGGLWSKAALIALVKALPKLLSCSMATERAIYVGLNLQWQGLPLGEFRCWQPDPMSAILLLRTSESAANSLMQPAPDSDSCTAPDQIIEQRIEQEFGRLWKDSNRFQLTSLGLLLRSTQAIGFTCMPAVIARYAERKVISQSLSLEQIKRISPEQKWLAGLPIQPTGPSSPLQEPQMTSLSAASAHWINLGGDAILRCERNTTTEDLEAAWENSSLTPLARCMIDFARRAVFLPTIVSGERSYRNFARRWTLLAHQMLAQWGDKDPGDLSEEQLEAGYLKMLDTLKGSEPNESNVRDFLRARKEFHSYLRNCRRKGRIKNEGLLAPRRMLDQIDVDILSAREYRTLRDEIALRMRGKRFEEYRDIATALCICGYRWGTRREEARKLRTTDLEVDDWVELLIRPSEGHTLKSASATRRLPGECLDEAEFDHLRRWHTSRVKKSGPDGYLFPNLNRGDGCISPKAFRVLNIMLASVTRTSDKERSTRFHDLRRSMSSFCLLRLLLPGNGQLVPDYLDKDDAQWLLSGEGFRPTEIRRRGQPWGSDVFRVSQMLGHLHPATTLSRYFVFASELLRLYIERSTSFKADDKVLATALCGRSSRQTVSADQAMKSAIQLLDRKAKSARQASSLIEPKNLEENNFYNRLIELHQFLECVESPNGPAGEMGELFGWNKEKSLGYFRSAKALRELKSSRSYRHHFRKEENGSRSIVPTLSNNPKDRCAFRDFAARVGKVIESGRKRDILLRGLKAYVTSVWYSRNAPVFSQPLQDATRANAFLALLEILKVRKKDVIFGSFDEERSDSRLEWRNRLSWRIPRFERMFEPSQKPRPWLSIEPIVYPSLDSGQNSGLFGFRLALVMSHIYLSGQIMGSHHTEA